MKRLSMILASLFLFVGMALAQTTVKGTVVTYEENEPIIGATIQVVGADNIGTITDVNGQFTLEVPAGKNTLKITLLFPASPSASSSAAMPTASTRWWWLPMVLRRRPR